MASMKEAAAKSGSVALHWFRKGLRLHDNPAFLDACAAAGEAGTVYPVFIVDPYFAKPDIIGVNRYSFLLQSLEDLDSNLRKLGSQLYVIRGKPEEQLPQLFQQLNVATLTFECDSEPYSRSRDDAIRKIATEAGITVKTHSSHTLHDMEYYTGLCGLDKYPTTYVSFQKLFNSLQKPREPVAAPDMVPTGGDSNKMLSFGDVSVPTLEEMGYPALPRPLKFPGGETEALRRMSATVIVRPQWVAQFEKPQTEPNSLQPSTTVLSPYLKFGCLSPSLLYYELQCIYDSNKTHSNPPVSLHGQLLFREFFYLNSYCIPNFGSMEGNPQCKQIPWQRDSAVIEAWKLGRTGYPFIDAIMTQLREEGWIHHLARHAVACFLTRGDLWQHWEEGVKVFDLYLLDGDWALNNANWQWLSCSNYFYQYFRCYSPVAFGKKTDKDGDYIRKYLPQLARLPTKYIYEPWTAPIHVQQASGCVIGVDYPERIVIHEEISKTNMGRMKAAYDAEKAGMPLTADTVADAATTGAESKASGKSNGGKRPTPKTASSSANSIEQAFKRVRK